MEQYKQEFIEFMVESNVLKFGDFTLKSGRKSPFFMNAGAYVTGSQLKRLGEYYAKAIHDKYGDDFDVLFGPAYKGIPISVVTAIAYSELYGKEIRYCSDRKEEKDHGADKGSFLGSKLQDGDRVVMIEDVTTSGKSMEETVPKVRGAANVEIVGLMVSLDRMEIGKGGQKCALEEVKDLYGFETNAIVTMAEVVEHLYNRECNGKVVIDDKLYKHMLHNFIYLKEAMFSKCIIFVEGDTENGAIPVFAERMGLDMDERGIGVIKLDGADSVKRCMALYKSFGIKSIALIDKDKKESYSSEPDIYFTKANDYEEDVYDNFKLTDYLKSCKELSGVEPYIPILRREGLNFNPGQFVENPANIEIDDTLQMKIMVENKDRELQKLKQSKNAAKGAVLAGYVTVIPPAFEKIINKLIKEVK